MPKNLEFEPQAEEDFSHWAKVNKKLARKIRKLFDKIIDTPFLGTGKPEPLKYHYADCRSRRIDKEHRLVYRVEGDTVIVLSCRYHYE